MQLMAMQSASAGLLMILKRFSLLINLAIVSLVVWALSGIFLTILSSLLEVSPRIKIVSNIKKPANVEKHSMEYYSVVGSKNIFNPSARASNGGPRKDLFTIEEQRPATDLKLELKGTITGDPKHSFAIIEDNDKKKQDLYRLNDTIKDAKLVKILEDKVIILRNGQEEALLMAFEDTMPDRKFLKKKAARSVERISGTKYRLDREAVTDAMGDLTQFMSQLSLKPHYVSGKPAGFQISKIKPGSLISKMGLRNGDVIKNINNMTIDSPEQAIEVYQQLQNESSLSIEVERRGRKKTYTYEIR